MPEFTDDDLSIIQSMMGSNVRDRRNPYAVVPPQMTTPTRAEQALTELPSAAMPPADQQASMDRDALLQQDDLQGMPPESLYGEGRGPRPIDQELVRAMRDALRPDLSNKNRPNAQELDLRRRHRSAAVS